MDMRNPAAGQSDCQQTGRLQNTLQTTDHLLQHRVRAHSYPGQVAPAAGCLAGSPAVLVQEAVLRLLKPDTRPAVPVAPEGQAQLLTFLQQAARQEHHDVVGLSWLSALHAEPASWYANSLTVCTSVSNTTPW